MRIFILIAVLVTCVNGFYHPHKLIRHTDGKKKPSVISFFANDRVPVRRDMKLQVFLLPQLGFIATCVAAIVTYIYFNIDEIREKQAATIDKAMNEQSVNVKKAQDLQRESIERAMRQQEENALRAKKAAEEARRRADEATRR